MDYDSEEKKAKGTKKCVIKRMFRLKNYIKIVILTIKPY